MNRVLNDFLGSRERLSFQNKLYKAFVVKYPEERSVPPHYHPEIEIIIPLGVRGTTLVAGRRYELINRGVHVIGPDMVHAFRIGPRGDGRIFVLQINPAECGKTVSRFAGCAPDTLKGQLTNLPVAYQGNTAPLVDICLGLSQVAQGSSNPFDAAVSDIERIYKIVGMVAGGGRKNIPARRIDSKIRRVIDLIETNAHEKLSLERIARESAISKYHLCRVFKKATGMTLQAYITDLRLNRAMRLMSEQGKNVTEACFETGFESLSYFIQVFRKAAGVTPKRWTLKQAS